MRLVLPDTNWSVRALLRGGHRRKLLVVFAYGHLSLLERFGPALIERISDQVARLQGASLGGLSLDRQIADAAAARAALGELLPAMTPDDLILCGTQFTFDELERIAGKAGKSIARDTLPDDIGQIVRRQLMAITPCVVEDRDPHLVPGHTEGRDRNDDFIIDAALQARAHFMLSGDEKDIALDPDDGMHYSDPETGRSVEAYRHEAFVRTHVNTSHFDVDDIDPGLLQLAHKNVAPSA